VTPNSKAITGPPTCSSTGSDGTPRDAMQLGSMIRSGPSVSYRGAATYDRNAALRWALDHWNDAEVFDSEDCTWFSSGPSPE
jgi:hypothetical protein